MARQNALEPIEDSHTQNFRVVVVSEVTFCFSLLEP